MTQLSVRQSGGANIVSIPKAVLHALGLHVGSALDLSIEDNKIILTPAPTEPTLTSLLEGSPRTSLKKSDEDKTWLNATYKGKEE